MDLLIALIDSAPRVVGKRELLARVWPGMVVEEGNLRFQIGVLRRALADGQAGCRYVVNVAGRGYCFVAPVSPAEEQSAAMESEIRPSALPPLGAGGVLGREQTFAEVEAMLRLERFVSIVGGGGVGKTTVAVALARALLAQFENGVRFVDLSMLTSASLVAETVAATVRPPRGGSSAMQVSSRTDGPRVLLILDNCEHVTEAVAGAVQNILCRHPQVHVLATSREPLGVRGELVYRLGPLDCPQEPDELTAATALQLPAVQLFVRSVAASGHRAELTDENACTIGRICRRLDGIPLALELAAGRVGAYGTKGVLAQLDGPHWLHWRAWRTAPTRQLTFGASLEWSYELLSESERTALHRLARVNGTFSIESSRLGATKGSDHLALRAQTLASLVDKSLVEAHCCGSAPCYRVLDTTRTFLERSPEAYLGPTTVPIGFARPAHPDSVTPRRVATRLPPVATRVRASA